MGLGYDHRLFVLAFDHRGSFKQKMFGIVGRVETAEETERLMAAKRLVFDGFVAAVEAGAPHGVGVLVDEEMGADVARDAKALGVPLAMPVEKSGQPTFDFEYGEQFGEHIESFGPDFAKVLVRWNPDDDDDTKAAQGERLARLGAWLAANGTKYLFELLVPASGRQLDLVGGSEAAYDSHLRPYLMLETIAEIRAAGVEPDVWKIEGIDAQDDCELIANLTRVNGRDAVMSVVLGRGADDAKVDHWLRMGAAVPGYGGFAIGRSIWWDAVAGWRDGTMEAAVAAALVAEKYRRFVDVYLAAT